MPSVPQRLLIAAAGIGIVTLNSFAIREALFLRSLERKGETVEATITASSIDVPGGRRTDIVSYRYHVAGKSFSNTERFFSLATEFDWHVGDTIDVRYLPARPEKARIPDPGEAMNIMVMLILFDALVGFVAFALWEARRRKEAVDQ